MSVILESKGLTKVFNNNSTVLNDVNVSINEGEFVAIMGQSGSGKSTLLYNISGMENPTKGEVIFEGKDIANISEEEMSKIRLTKMGFIFQNSHLLKNLNIKDNIMLPALKAKIKGKKEVENETEQLMKKLKIDGISNHDIKRVSGGQLQRAAICRALINYPKMIFADEPTGALNSSSTLEVMNILNVINNEGTTLLVVTHDPKVAMRAERIIFIADGNVDDELVIGKYKEGLGIDNTKRQAKVSEWLKTRGF